MERAPSQIHEVGAGQNCVVRPNLLGLIGPRVDRSIQTGNSVQAGKQTQSWVVWFGQLRVGDSNPAKPVFDGPNIYLLYKYFTIYKILKIKPSMKLVVLCLAKYFSSHHKFLVTINNPSSRYSHTRPLFLVFSDLHHLRTLFAPTTSLLITFSLQEQHQLKILSTEITWERSHKKRKWKEDTDLEWIMFLSCSSFPTWYHFLLSFFIWFVLGI